jgi:hypothetical protein
LRLGLLQLRLAALQLRAGEPAIAALGQAIDLLGKTLGLQLRMACGQLSRARGGPVDTREPRGVLQP